MTTCEIPCPACGEGLTLKVDLEVKGQDRQDGKVVLDVVSHLDEQWAAWVMTRHVETCTA